MNDFLGIIVRIIYILARFLSYVPQVDLIGLQQDIHVNLFFM